MVGGIIIVARQSLYLHQRMDFVSEHNDGGEGLRHGDALVICWADGRCSADAQTISDEVSNNIAKQHLKEDGGGISNRRGEIPGFLPERGFLDRIIPQREESCSRNRA